MDSEQREKAITELEERLRKRVPPELPIGQEKLPAGTKIVSGMGQALLKSHTKDELYYWDDYCEGHIWGEVESAKFFRQSIRELCPENFSHALSVERTRVGREFSVNVLIPRYEAPKQPRNELALLSDLRSDLVKALTNFEFSNQNHPFLEKVVQCWRAGGVICGMDGDSREQWPDGNLLVFWPWPQEPEIEGTGSEAPGQEGEIHHVFSGPPEDTPDDAAIEKLSSADYWQIVNEDGADGFWASEWFDLLEELDELEPIAEESIPDPSDPTKELQVGPSSAYVSADGEVVGTIVCMLYEHEHDFDSDDDFDPDWPVIQLASLTGLPKENGREPMMKIMQEIAERLNETLSACEKQQLRGYGSVIWVNRPPGEA